MNGRSDPNHENQE